MRGRIKADLAPEMARYIAGPGIAADNERSFYNMADINRAHVLMLVEEGIIDKEVGAGLLKTLNHMREEGSSALEMHAEYEDYYYNIEKIIISRVGMDIGGKMHTARSRNDLGSTMLRMNVRDSLIKIIPMVYELEKVLLNMAEKNKDTILTGYTHMQPAQPISLAYYLIAVAEAIERDIQRIQDALNRMNYCTLGSCAFAGTSFHINRFSTAKRLGFFGPVHNAMDAVASRDYLQEITAAFTILATDISRLCADFYYWCTDEFAYFEMDDSFAVCSSIMPQKKNPTPFEHVRGKCAHMLAAFTSVTTVLKGIAFGHNRDVGGEAPHLYWDAYEQMEASLAVLTGALRTIKVRKDRMEYRVNANFCTVTELADELAKKEKLPFRVAHEIVAEIVANRIENGKTCLDIDPAVLDEFSEKYVGRKLNWDKSYLQNILDARRSVLNKGSYGACSIEECSAMIEDINGRLSRDKLSFDGFLTEMKVNRSELDEKIATLVEALSK